MRTATRIIIAGTVGLVVIAGLCVSAGAQLATPTPLLTSAQDEDWPAATKDFLVWSQNTPGNPDHFDVFARLRSGGPTWRVNAPTTWGWVPSAIAGTERFVYQQANAKLTDSDIYFYDPSTKTRTKLPTKVNSDAWEYWPVASSKYVLFSRLTSRERVLLLYDRQTGRLRTIATMSKKADIAGTWVGTGSAVYEKCSAKTYACAIYRWTPGMTTKVPGQAAPWSQYGGVLDEATGDLYYFRTTIWCGLFVEIRRWNVSGSSAPVVIYDLPEGIDGSDLSLAPNVAVSTDEDLLFSQYDCMTEQDDAYQIEAVSQVVGEPPSLAVAGSAADGTATGKRSAARGSDLGDTGQAVRDRLAGGAGADAHAVATATITSSAGTTPGPTCLWAGPGVDDCAYDPGDRVSG